MTLTHSPSGTDKHFREHRVIVWPQSFFINHRTNVLCYDKQLLEERSHEFVRRRTGLEMHNFTRPNTKASRKKDENDIFEMTEGMCAQVRQDLYPTDAFLWDTICADGQKYRSTE